MDDKCKLCKNREEMCNDSMAMQKITDYLATVNFLKEVTTHEPLHP